jgi:folylpolyglutamate synthase/dihydropteroate synthase
MAAATLPEAVAAVETDTLIAGSLYLAGEALRLNEETPQ